MLAEATQYLEHNLNDGLDLIEEAMKIRPDLENYVPVD